MLLLLFFAGRERYCLEVARVREITPLVSFQREIASAEGLAGLVNYRGDIVPVVDMSQVLAGIPCPAAISTRIAFVDYQGTVDAPCVLGLILERATETISVDPRDFQKARVDMSEVGKYCGDILLDEKGIIQRLDVERALSPSLKKSLFPHLLEKRS